jgi:hypothetical protein
MTVPGPVLLVLAYTCFPTLVWAQQATSLDDVDTLIAPNQRVLVKDVVGASYRGAVVDAGESFLTLRYRDDDGIERTRRFELGSVSEIRRADRLWNGLFIGLGAGIVGAEVFVYKVCGPRGYDDECSAIASLVGWATFVPGGAVVGALLDKAIGNRILYSRAGSRIRVSVSPVISPASQGVLARIRF